MSYQNSLKCSSESSTDTLCVTPVRVLDKRIAFIITSDKTGLLILSTMQTRRNRSSCPFSEMSILLHCFVALLNSKTFLGWSWGETAGRRTQCNEKYFAVRNVFTHHWSPLEPCFGALSEFYSTAGFVLHAQSSRALETASLILLTRLMSHNLLQTMLSPLNRDGYNVSDEHKLNWSPSKCRDPLSHDSPILSNSFLYVCSSWSPGSEFQWRSLLIEKSGR